MDASQSWQSGIVTACPVITASPCMSFRFVFSTAAASSRALTCTSPFPSVHSRVYSNKLAISNQPLLFNNTEVSMVISLIFCSLLCFFFFPGTWDCVFLQGSVSGSVQQPSYHWFTPGHQQLWGTLRQLLQQVHWAFSWIAAHGYPIILPSPCSSFTSWGRRVRAWYRSCFLECRAWGP